MPGSEASQPVTVVIPCGKAKRFPAGRAPAREAYVGSPFKVNSRYAEAVAPGRWLILSAKYGLLDPDEEIEDYNVSFNRPASGPIETAALAAQARARGLSGRVIGLGGKEYVQALRMALSGLEAVELDFPFAGLSLGRAMAAVKRATPPATSSSSSASESPKLSASGGTGPPQEREEDMASKKLSGVEAAAEVLRENDGGPMKLAEIVEGALKKAKHLKGRGSVQAPLDAAAKKGRLFKKTGPGMYALLDAEVAPEAKTNGDEAEVTPDETDADLKAAAKAADEASKRATAKREADEAKKVVADTKKADEAVEVTPDPKPEATKKTRKRTPKATPAS